jgi:hypothetical protein
MNCRFHTSLLVLTAFLILLLGACGGSKESTTSERSLVPALPPCANAGPVVDLPSEFPTSFPLPPGTVITFSQQTEKAASVSGFIPMEFKKTVSFFQSNLPGAGYQLLEGDAEMDEAESTFSGHGFHGKWKVNGILNCPGAVTLTIAVSKVIALKKSG